MRINTNNWNKIRYTLYTPGYDLLGRLLNESRKKSIDSLELKPDDKVLIVGAGTGLDLEFISVDCEITATDITPSMIKKLRNRNSRLQRRVKSLVMDGQSLDFSDNSFDYVILHLILAVIPDPSKCLQEIERVLKKGGQVAVFDKFVGKGRKVSRIRKSANLFTNILSSDITRDFESILENTSLNVISDEKADFDGIFRLIKLEK
jgi:phosphatidylethanolamine/phosphatidyl-N-methylethanolamine N-methyltransferase